MAKSRNKKLGNTATELSVSSSSRLYLLGTISYIGSLETVSRSNVVNSTTHKELSLNERQKLLSRWLMRLLIIVLCLALVALLPLLILGAYRKLRNRRQRVEVYSYSRLTAEFNSNLGVDDDLLLIG